MTILPLPRFETLNFDQWSKSAWSTESQEKPTTSEYVGRTTTNVGRTTDQACDGEQSDYTARSQEYARRTP